MQRETMSKKYSVAFMALMAGLAFSSSLLAQPFEEIFGDKLMKDEGHRRVTPVTQCPDGGYIAIGTRDVGGFSLVYVVRTKDSGARIWERYYDVGNDLRPDEGYALVELKDGSGFVTTGTSNRGGQWPAHAMKIDCNGKDVFAFFYPVPTTAPYRLVGHDIREAYSGDGGLTNAGDLLIAGWVETTGPRTDAMLLRLDKNGNLVWHRRYDTGVDEKFFGLTETKATYSPTGDIAAVGVFDTVLGSQALVARVDGLTGGLGGPDQCMAAYGDVGEENFQSIVETETWPDTGTLTMAGLSTSPGLRDDVYVVQTKPNPCGMLAQVTLGNEGGNAFHEHATDLVEVLYPVDPGLGVPVGAFALTGAAETKYSPADAFLLFVKPGSLHPLAARRYGDHGDFVDFGTSLDQNVPWGPQPAGFIIAGTTFTDWDHSGDPSDLYLIQPTDSGKTSCEKEWFPDGKDRSWKPRRLDPRIDKFVRQVPVAVNSAEDRTELFVCR